MFTYRDVLISNVAERRFYDKLRQKIKLRHDVWGFRRYHPELPGLCYYSSYIRHLRTKIISWPTHQEKQVIKDHYERKNGFPNIIGSLDGTRIRISAPSENQKSYINRKGFHSIQLQAVCREDLTFTHCFTGFPGSVHDSRILKNSDLWDYGQELCGNDHILADGGYPLQTWLLTLPGQRILTPNQRHFNSLLSSNRVSIERAFGLLKGRFPRLTSLVVNRVETAVDIIMACCVLHNVCIQQDVKVELMQ
ncbi:putative nuclease HARBI1 [Ruditapes philippinarum]|uniref:putative nuclease HARBI1 n=1 Tax=Ruditapes philippinarum TaxID=129788 RepID=UPI00295B1D44|nr:putative nuclease HARBI1 [Ruditapes philippinarum]